MENWPENRSLPYKHGQCYLLVHEQAQHRPEREQANVLCVYDLIVRALSCSKMLFIARRVVERLRREYDCTSEPLDGDHNLEDS